MEKTFKNVCIASLVLFGIYCALTIGISWDGPIHLQEGYNKLKYLFSLGSINEDFPSSKYYPGLSFAITAFIVKFFPPKFEYEAYHLITFFFSLSIVYGISKIGRELFNSKVSKIIFLLCFFYPIFFGHMAMNGKDTMMALCNIWISYLVIRYFKNQSIAQKRKNYVFKLGFLLALGTGIRLVFISTLVPFLIFSLFEILYFKKIVVKKFCLKKLLIDLLKIFIIFYLILIIFWSHTHENILIMPIKIFIDSFDMSFGAPISLLNGEFYHTNTTPKSYIILNFFYKTPEFLLFLFLLSFYFFIKHNPFFNKKFENFNYKLSLIFVIIILSNILFISTPYPIYDGMRLFLYIIPFFILIPSLSVYFVLNNLHLKRFKILSVFLVLSIIVFATRFIAITPYQYTYLNFFAGKPSNHSLKFENDYWGVSLKELIKKSNFLNEKIKLAYCGVPRANVKYYLEKYKFSKVSLVHPSDDGDYNYIIMTNRAVWSDGLNDIKKAQSCFQKYSGKKFSSVERNGLLLSTIREKNK